VRTIEEVKNYAMRPSLKMKSGTIILIILAVLFLIGGIAIFMFMPQITEMFKGFV
jgi:flagellar basal body-associated protein FliL